MQATVASYDPHDRSGTVLLDDGVEVPFTSGAPDQGLRLLRPGQRVRVETRGAGADLHVTRLQILTLR